LAYFPYLNNRRLTRSSYCLCVCVPPNAWMSEQWSQKRRPLLDNGSVNTYSRRNEYTCSNRISVRRRVFCAIRVELNAQYMAKGKSSCACEDQQWFTAAPYQNTKVLEGSKFRSGPETKTNFAEQGPIPTRPTPSSSSQQSLSI
jgi:hypothetical protein